MTLAQQPSPYLQLDEPAGNGLIYLDNGATSFPKPELTYTFMDTFYRNYGVNPGRSGFDLCLEAGSLVDETRKLLCRFFGGTDANRLVFGSNSTDALNLAIFGLIKPGDHVVSTHVEHNATLRPLWKLEQEGVDVDWVDFDDQGWVDPEEMIRRFKPNTTTVVMNHGSNVIGTVQDVAPVGRACRERGIRLILDVSQTAGMVPVQLDQLGADVICFTGHKSLMGPMGIGGMYVREGVEIARTRAGGTGVKSAQRSHLDEYPYRMEYGTPNLPGIAGLNAGVKWVERLGLAAIHRHEMALWTRLRDGLRDLAGVTLYCAEDVPGRERISVLSFNVDGLEAMDTGTMLDVDHNIACRTGLHCTPMVHEHLGTDKLHGAVRFGIGPFNTEAHIDAAIRGVADIAGMQRARESLIGLRYSATLKPSEENPMITQEQETRMRALRNLVGNTPLLAVDLKFQGRLRRIYAKAENLNMTGSIKDRMALHILRMGYQRGALAPGAPIAEATSGNTGISFSALGRAMGHPVTIFMPDWMSQERKDLIRSLGAQIRLVSKEEGGFLGSIALSEAYAAEHPGCFLPRQFANQDNCEAHASTTGPEIWWQLRFQDLKPDAFIAGVGTGGTIMGVGSFLRSVHPAVKVHPLEPANSPTLSTGCKVGKHRIQGISDEFIPSIMQLDDLDGIISVDDGDAILMAQKLAAGLGLGVGISSGANLLGALLVQERLGPDAVVVTVFPDDNKKYLSTDLMRDEPAKDGFLSPAVELQGFQAFKRSCALCCDFDACGLVPPESVRPEVEAFLAGKSAPQEGGCFFRANRPCK